MNPKPLHWPNLLTLLSVAILVGVELVGAGWAAGWAIGGLFQLSGVISDALEVLFVLAGLVGLAAFMRAAVKAEPVRG